MKTQIIELQASAPGVRHSLQVLRFGTQGAGPKAVVQAAVHADEVPAMLVALALKTLLQDLERRGLIRGEVVLLPTANPLGLGQQVMGVHHGRFDLGDGANFNRGYPNVTSAVAQAVGGLLGDDPQRNMRLVRDAIRHAVRSLPASTPAQDLKNRLMQLAADSDFVLDLHCDSEAVMHVYALTPQEPQAIQLGALLGAKAILLATESGDSPFDEACTRPWYELRQMFANHPLPLGCFGATVELRGQADTSQVLAAQDAQAIAEFLRQNGVLGGAPAELPPLLCAATPLAGSEPVIAPHAGVVVFCAELGQRVAAGERVADLIDPATGEVQALCAQSSGVVYARCATRWAHPGKRLAKIAGTSLSRTGKLLSP